MATTALKKPTDFGLRSLPQRRPSVAFVCTHPIQYAVPFLRYLESDGHLDVVTYYGSDHSLKPSFDKGYGKQVDWGVDLLSGYRSEFLPTLPGGEGYSPGFRRPMIHGLRKRFAAQRPDLVWVSGYSRWISLYAIYAARSLGIPVYVESDSNRHDRPRSRAKLLIKSLYMQALVAPHLAGCLNVGTWSREYWEQYLTPDRHDFIHFPHTVDNEAFQQRIQQARETHADMSLRAQYDIPTDAPVLLFTGRLDRIKGCDTLIEAHAQLLKRNLTSYLVLVGAGPHEAELRAQIAPEQAAYVRFAGFQDQIALAGFLAMATIFVLPSRREPWAMVINEAMNAALPIVVSDRVGAGVDLVADGINGYRVPHSQGGPLADALDRILSEPGRARAFGDASLYKINHWSFRERAAGLLAACEHVRQQRDNKGSRNKGTGPTHA